LRLCRILVRNRLQISQSCSLAQRSVKPYPTTRGTISEEGEKVSTMNPFVDLRTGSRRRITRKEGRVGLEETSHALLAGRQKGKGNFFVRPQEHGEKEKRRIRSRLPPRKERKTAGENCQRGIHYLFTNLILCPKPERSILAGARVS